MRGDIRRKALELLEPLYQAEFVEDGWPIFLRRLMDVVESDVAIAVSLDAQMRPFDLKAEGVFTQHMVADYQAHFAAIDPWALAFVKAHKPLGKNARSQELLDPRDFERTEYYADFWRPNHDLFHTCGALVRLDGGFANVGFPRCRDRGPFDASDVAFLDLIAPHISNALRTHHRLGRSREIGAAAIATLDRMDDAMLIVDGRGRLIHANAVAETELARGTRLSVRDGRLIAGLRTERCEFERALHAAVSVSEQVATCSPLTVATREPELVRRASISFYPLPRRSRDAVALEHACVLVVVCAEPGTQTISAPLLHGLFGLTAMEARVAQDLSQGTSIEEIAARLSIGLGTVRTHLKHVFLKTGTRRQGQLIALLNRLRPRIAP